jgi:hypothetical protein
MLARRSAASAARSAEPVETATTLAVTVELLRGGHGADVVEIRFDRDLDRVDLVVEQPENDVAIHTFREFAALSTGLGNGG